MFSVRNRLNLHAQCGFILVFKLLSADHQDCTVTGFERMAEPCMQNGNFNRQNTLQHESEKFRRPSSFIYCSHFKNCWSGVQLSLAVLSPQMVILYWLPETEEYGVLVE